jgi:hypothetical protein
VPPLRISMHGEAEMDSCAGQQRCSAVVGGCRCFGFCFCDALGLVSAITSQQGAEISPVIWVCCESSGDEDEIYDNNVLVKCSIDTRRMEME